MREPAEKVGIKFDIQSLKWKKIRGTLWLSAVFLLCWYLCSRCRKSVCTRHFTFVSGERAAGLHTENTPLVWTSLPQLMHVTSSTRLLHFWCELLSQCRGAHARETSVPLGGWWRLSALAICCHNFRIWYPPTQETILETFTANAEANRAQTIWPL